MVARLSVEQVVSLENELQAVVSLMDRGLDELWRMDGSEGTHDLPMQLLSQGLERFLQLTYALLHLEQAGRLPAIEELRRDFGHNIPKFTDAVVELVTHDVEYISKPVVRAQLDFIRHDRHLERVLALLGAFGSWSRYYHLNRFLEPSSVKHEDDPELAWRALCRYGHGRMAALITDRLKQFMKAMADMWTLGPLGEEARKHAGLVESCSLFVKENWER